MDDETRRLLKEIPSTTESLDDVPRATFTNFARKSTLREQNGRIYGNWINSFSGACVITWEAYIEKTAIIRMVEMGACSDGGKVVMAEHY